MSELPNDPEIISSDPETVTEPQTGGTQPYDMDLVYAATDTHTAAVKAAHETLAQHMQDVYGIFKQDLDRAYQIWEDAINVVRQGAGIVNSIQEATHASTSDPTAAR